MSSDTKSNEVNDLTVTYGVSVVSLILALALGALSVGIVCEGEYIIAKSIRHFWR